MGGGDRRPSLYLYILHKGPDYPHTILLWWFSIPASDVDCEVLLGLPLHAIERAKRVSHGQ